MEFIERNIEDIPLITWIWRKKLSFTSSSLKELGFKEIYRVLKLGEHFYIFNMVLNGIFPKGFMNNTSMYAGVWRATFNDRITLRKLKKPILNILKLSVEKRF